MANFETAPDAATRIPREGKRQMPWKIVERENEFCVIKQRNGKTEACHPSKEKAMRHLRALEANTSEEGKGESV